MALKFTIKTERIDFGDDDYIEVRGLSVPDISQLFQTHGEVVSLLYDRFTGRAKGQEFTVDDQSALGLAVTAAFPAVTAHVIAIAADAPEQFQVIGKLPIDVQAAALEKIAKLTFAMAGGPKNFLEIVVRMAEGASGLLKQVEATPLLSKTGSGASAAK